MCLECDETEDLQQHPEYPGDKLCLDCLIQYWETEENEAQCNRIDAENLAKNIRG